MPDKSFLDWPFFEDRHRTHAAALEEWATDKLAHVDHDDIDASCASLVSAMGADGFLMNSAVDPVDPDALLDVRTLCLTRALIGQTGEGFKIAMSVLDVFRSTVAAAALGFARRALDESLSRVSSRKVQGQSLFDLQMVQGHIAEMALRIDAAALLVYRAAWTKDSGAPRVSREAAMAKLFSTDEAQKVIDAAVQLHGGDGVRSGAMVERLYREIRALRIYEGASDVQKVIIARTTMANAT
jgi:acyl-CoA dehydrogenase